MDLSEFEKEALQRPPASTFFLIVSFNHVEVFFQAKSSAQRMFSKVYLESNTMPKWTPDISERYTSRIGEVTKILAFKRRIHREELPDLKKKCIDLQIKLKKKDSSVRLIPGYLSPHNVVLSSTSDDFHRIYLFHGVYAEVVYKYEKLQLQCLDTTPEFFYSKEVGFFFSALRDYHINTRDKK
ncbi:MAG: DUF4416 family protein [Leptospiraceae bacterium]|nr:DUF4416 family protein [Leptospiraceae bacterium]MCP5512092.1 DUF4416 family protein [Leptospiraceae bacterium]